MITSDCYIEDKDKYDALKSLVNGFFNDESKMPYDINRPEFKKIWNSHAFWNYDGMVEFYVSLSQKLGRKSWYVLIHYHANDVSDEEVTLREWNCYPMCDCSGVTDVDDFDVALKRTSKGRIPYTPIDGGLSLTIFSEDLSWVCYVSHDYELLMLAYDPSLQSVVARNVTNIHQSEEGLRFFGTAQEAFKFHYNIEPECFKGM